MSRNAIQAAVAALGTSGLLASGLPSTSAASAPCQPIESTTLASSPHARVFQRGGATYGCLHSAFGESRLGKEYIGFFVRVVDLRRGKSVSFTETGPATQQAKHLSLGNAFGIGPAVSLRLRATGQVAWIARAQYFDGPPRYEIRKREGAVRTRLAAGEDIDPASLALRGNRLSWRQADRQSTSTLGPRPR